MDILRLTAAVAKVYTTYSVSFITRFVEAGKVVYA